jgi:hypothetical protein
MSHLRLHGCRIEREGTRHTIFVNPDSGSKAPVPRHTEIDNRLAVKICQQLAVPTIR